MRPGQTAADRRGARSVARRVPAIAVPAAVRLDASASRRDGKEGTVDVHGSRRARNAGPLGGELSVPAAPRPPHRSWLKLLRMGTVGARSGSLYPRSRSLASLLDSRGVSQSLSLGFCTGGGGPPVGSSATRAMCPTSPDPARPVIPDEGQSRAKWPTPPHLWHVFLHPRVRHRGRTRRLGGAAASAPRRNRREVAGRLVELIVGPAHGMCMRGRWLPVGEANNDGPAFGCEPDIMEGRCGVGPLRPLRSPQPRSPLSPSPGAPPRPRSHPPGLRPRRDRRDRRPVVARGGWRRWTMVSREVGSDEGGERARATTGK